MLVIKRKTGEAITILSKKGRELARIEYRGKTQDRRLAIRVTLADRQPADVKLEPGGNITFSGEDPDTVLGQIYALKGYGANRLTIGIVGLREEFKAVRTERVQAKPDTVATEREAKA